MMGNAPFKRRTRAKTATVAFPFLTPLSNTPFQDMGTNLQPFTAFSKNRTTVGQQPHEFTKFKKIESSTFSEELGIPNPNIKKINDSNSASNFHSTLSQPPQPPPLQRYPLPLNPKLRILKTAQALRESTIEKEKWNSKLVKNYEDFPIPTTVKFLSKPPNNQEKGKMGIKCDDKIKNEGLGAEIENEHREVNEIQRLSESLHLDEAGLNQFPNLGPNHRHIKLLSLQHNIISRLQNLVLLKNLILLDLYNNKIDRISGLESFYCLRVLLLGKNRIRRIEGFDAVPRLEILDLHGNQLRYLDNLNTLKSLRIFNVAGNNIRSIRNFEPSSLSSLTELNLKRNRIRSLLGLEKMSQLRKLLLSNNELQSISSLQPLQNLSNLEELLLDGNPLSSLPEYKSQVLILIPSLIILNRFHVTDIMRIQAQFWEPSHISQKQQLKSKQEKCGAPITSSREEVIDEARRRWESVRNYVRNHQDKVNTKSHHLNRDGRRAKSESRNSTPQHLNERNHEELQKHLSYNFVNIPKLNSSNNNKCIPNHSKHNFQTKKLKINKSNPKQVNEDSENQTLNISSKFEFCSSPKSTKVAIVRPFLRNCNFNQNTTDDVLQNDFTRICNDQYEDQKRHLKASCREFDVEIENAYDKQDTLISSEKSLNSTIVKTLPKSSIITKPLTTDDALKYKRNDEIIVQKYSDVKIEESNTTLALLRKSICKFPELDTKKTKRNETFSSLTTTPNINLNLRMQQDGKDVEEIKIWRKDKIFKPWKKDMTRSSSVDLTGQTSDSEATSTTNTSEATTSGRPRRVSVSVTRHVFHRKSKKRGQTAKCNSGASVSSKFSIRRPLTGTKDCDAVFMKKTLKRVNSFSKISSTITETVKKQGLDYLVEIDGKTLNLYGQGALRHFLTGFPESLLEGINCVKFHFITYDSIIPYFVKLRQTYPAAEHFQFRSNNIYMLGQLNAMADLQGLTSLQISQDGNPIIEIPFWKEYAHYRLGHWGLKEINGKEVTCEYNGGSIKNKSSKIFESLGYLGISCLPEASLTPLAKKLHTLQNFCSCSQSSSSDESGRKKISEMGDSGSSERICSSWDDDPVLMDVIGKEALVYVPYKENENVTLSSEEIISKVVTDGNDMLEKLNQFNHLWPQLLENAIEDILTDYASMDEFIQKELKKLKNLALLMNKNQ